MRFIRSLSCTLSLLATALADVEFISPKAGAVLRAGDVVTVHWKDTGSVPRISQFTQYDLYLCAGEVVSGYNEEVAILMKDVLFARGNSVSFKIDPELGADVPDAYFLKMVSSGPDAFTINYSQHFTISGMTGSFAPIPGYYNQSVTGDRTELRKRQEEGAYTIPYELQVGPTRYAPMAKMPGTAIPANSSPTPLHPTSAYDIATTFLPMPTIQATMSASPTYSWISIENTASPAPNPQDAQMKKFLERWKD
ncbi:Ser-Thr-rich glycosyl-phosphatidyl-inositol-anchored membrane family-domain-containing protein [Aspergillus ambiguus]|uniref:putative beta-1,6-glucan biosynthesis protein (Knh1) n=1 Tax=Aspergillus ambiguus TaxID=176160 RepID=UPI003CCCCAF4